MYSDLNLHVSRELEQEPPLARMPTSCPEYDKQVDVFYPDLIAANKQYARDLLTHVNPYTKTRYADEPAVAFVEINNEDTLFLWGGEQNLAKLPDPYAQGAAGSVERMAGEEVPGAAERCSDAWAVGAQPPGPNLLKDPRFESRRAGQDAGWWSSTSRRR